MITNSRRGVSLIEMLVAMVVASIMAAAMMSLMLSQNRFQERSEGQRAARIAGRSAVNVITGELRMVDPSWGVEAASNTSITVKAPYALGLICSSTTTTQVVALLPVDSVMFAVAGYSGFAWRSNGGVYTTVAGGSYSEGSFPAACTSANIQNMTAPSSAPNQKTRVVTITLPGGTLASALNVGTVVLMYRRIRFYFGTSGQTGLSGRNALWRDYLDDGAAAIEMVAPFDANAAFNFYVFGSSASTTTVPGTLSALRGFELFLPGESDNIARQRSTPEEADLTTAVFFLNTTS